MNSNTRTVRIQWGDCDPAGIIFNARYFEIFDASTAALFERALGITKREMLETYSSAGFPLVRTTACFLKPARFGDDVAVDSVITFGRSSFQVEHRVSLKGELCAEGAETRVWVVRAPDGVIRSSPVPVAVREKFASSDETAEPSQGENNNFARQHSLPSLGGGRSSDAVSDARTSI